MLFGVAVVAVAAFAVAAVDFLGAGENRSAAVFNFAASSAAGQPGTTALQPIDANFFVFQLNINNFDVRIDLLDILLSLYDFPDI